MGTNQAKPVTDDEYAGLLAHDFRGLVENELNQAWILVGLLRQSTCLLGGFHRGQVDLTAFGLGHDLLRNRNDVAVLQGESASGESVEKQ